MAEGTSTTPVLHPLPSGIEMKEDNVIFRDGEGYPLLRSVIDDYAFPHYVSKNSLRSVGEMSIRDDDIWISSYPKSGTHWTWEIVNMLLSQEARVTKHQTMPPPLEFFSKNVEDLEAQDLGSRRHITSHLSPRHLPTKLLASKAKIIYVYRNPKDIIVSYYHHMRTQPRQGYNGTWGGYFSWFINNPDQVPYRGPVDHAREWVPLKYTLQNRMLVVSFEDMKKDLAKAVREIAEHLDISLSDELCDQIAQKANFQKMVKEKEETREKNRLFVYRKGDVGDWKNHFTVTQSEALDASLVTGGALPLDYIFSLDDTTS